MRRIALTAMILGLTFGGASFAEGAPSFMAVDVNYDGGISKSEAAKVKEDFEKADVNKSGKSSPGESWWRPATARPTRSVVARDVGKFTQVVIGRASPQSFHFNSIVAKYLL